MAMKYVPGVESGGSRAFICRIISDGFMSQISGNLCSSNALAQRFIGVSRHKQRLQLLVGVLRVLVDLRQAVVDAAADVGGEGGEQVIVFC
jgi:hypothetical protein